MYGVTRDTRAQFGSRIVRTIQVKEEKKQRYIIDIYIRVHIHQSHTYIRSVHYPWAMPCRSIPAASSSLYTSREPPRHRDGYHPSLYTSREPPRHRDGHYECHVVSGAYARRQHGPRRISATAPDSAAPRPALSGEPPRHCDYTSREFPRHRDGYHQPRLERRLCAPSVVIHRVSAMALTSRVLSGSSARRQL